MNHLGCVLDETKSGETMAPREIKKSNSRLKFPDRKNRFLDVPLRRLLCNGSIQPQIDYVCTAWYLKFGKETKGWAASYTKQTHQILLEIEM